MRPDFGIGESIVYLDNAATTRIDPEVVEGMQEFLEEKYANPETRYELGRESKEAVEGSRETISDALKCSPEEVFFTSGGTESNNWAIKGRVFRNRIAHLLISEIEHPSVTGPAEWSVNQFSGKLGCVRVNAQGIADLKELDSILSENIIDLVSIQFANNEIGTIQPVREISEICHKHSALFHCDAVQAFGKVKFDVDEIGADMVSISSHKIHGPMGIGVLYVRDGVEINPLIHGGGQERGMRSGTMFVPEVVGFGIATEMAMDSLKTHMPRLESIRTWMADRLTTCLGAKINGCPEHCLPNIVSATIPGVESDVVCGIMSSKYKVCMAGGSACSTLKKGSEVLKAIGMTERDAKSTFRFSMSRFNVKTDVVETLGMMQEAMENARKRDLI